MLDPSLLTYAFRGGRSDHRAATPGDTMFRSALAASQVSSRVMNPRRARPPIFRPWLFLAFAALLSGAGIAGLYIHRYGAVNNATSALVEPPVIAVTVVPVEVRPLARTVIGDGSVVAWQELAVSAEVAGLRVAEVAVDEGDQVQRGEVLVRFDASLLNAQAAQAEAGVKEAEAALQFLQSDVARAVELSRGAFIAAQTVEQRQSAARQAEARLVLARARRDEAAARLVQTRLVAPTDGVVIRRSAQPGTVSAVGQEMFRLVRDGRLELDAKVPELELAAVQTGQTARVLHGDEIVQATVRSVAPMVATDTRLGVVHIALPGGSGLRPGMFARVEIHVDAAPALVVPQAAVTFRGDVPVAFVLDDNGRVLLRRLTTGMRRDGLVEVLAGLQSGQFVITSGAGFLSDGDRVQVVRPLVVAEHHPKAEHPGVGLSQ
jgi:RND family efflux transporter MFP subunit